MAAAIPIGQYVLQTAAAVNGNYLGGPLQPAEVAAGNDMLAPGFNSSGNAQNGIKGIIGNEASAYFIQESDPGAVLIGKEVTIRVNGMRTDLDNLFVNSEGYFTAPEAKFGPWARFTANQRKIIPPGGGGSSASLKEGQQLMPDWAPGTRS